MHLLLLVGGIYFSKVTKRNVPKTQFEVGRTSMLNYVLHIGTRALWNRFHNRHLKNQTICNRHTNSQRIFMWIQNDTFCLCRDLNNTLGIFFYLVKVVTRKKFLKKNVILKPRNPVYNLFLETGSSERTTYYHNTDKPTSPPQELALLFPLCSSISPFRQWGIN